MEISADQVKALRDKTGMSMMLVRKALVEADGNEARALEVLGRMGEEISEKKATREINAGVIDAYIHHNKQVGVMMKVKTETDFVANNPEFQQAIHQIAMHIAAMGTESVEVLLAEPIMTDPTKTVKEIISGLTSKFGERVEIDSFTRMSLS
ncbi:MAG: hypothetical protein AAB343_02470 [Patescibacteria group bacterium]